MQEIVTYRFRVVLSGATSSPFLLQRTLTHHLLTYVEPVAKSLISNFYVDSFAQTYGSVEEMLKECPVINQILLEANMPLQSWYSSNAYFNSLIQEGISEVNVNVLGLTWNIAQDTLFVNVSKQIQQYVEKCSVPQSQSKGLPKHKTVSKRMVVSLISSVFDNLGLISPLLIGPKIFIQKFWHLKLSWDSPLEPELCAEFYELCKNLCNISVLEFPHFAIVPFKCELHVFADASKRAYGFAAYSVQLECQNSYLLLSKSRVAPVKELTIPRLELTALNLASKLVSTLMECVNLSFTSCTLWSDSKVSISWVKYHRSRLLMYMFLTE